MLPSHYAFYSCFITPRSRSDVYRANTCYKPALTTLQHAYRSALLAPNRYIVFYGDLPCSAAWSAYQFVSHGQRKHAWLTNRQVVVLASPMQPLPCIQFL